MLDRARPRQARFYLRQLSELARPVIVLRCSRNLISIGPCINERIKRNEDTSMFVGHYAAALAAKAVEPRAPLWSYVVASQLVDWGWSGLVIAGVERLRLDPSLPGSHLVLLDMPWTHSLPGALVWPLAAAVVARIGLRVPAVAATMVGVVVFSHWLGDLLVHRADLLLYPGGPKVGLALWNYPLPEMILELGLLGVSAILWTAQRKAEGRHTWPAALFFAALAMLQFVSVALPTEGTPERLAGTALLSYVVVALGAWLMDRKPVQT